MGRAATAGGQRCPGVSAGGVELGLGDEQGPGQVGRAEVGATQIRSEQVRATQVGPLQERSDQQGAPQIGPAQVLASQVGADQVRIRMIRWWPLPSPILPGFVR